MRSSFITLLIIHIFDDFVKYWDRSNKEYETYGLKNRDIMIARTGGTIGKSYIVRNLAEKAVFASYLIRVIPLANIDEEYLKVFMESPLYWGQLKSYSMGTGQPNVNGQSLKSLLLPLPPLAEQHRIVAKIEELLPHIADYDVAESKLTALNAAFPVQIKKSILQAAVQGKLVEQYEGDEPASVLLEQIRDEKERLIREKKIKRGKPLLTISEEEVPFELPDGWVWCRVSDLAQLINGDRGINYPSKDKLTSNPNSGLPFISAGNLTDGSIKIDSLLFLSQAQFDLLGSGKFIKNDVIFCLRGSLGKNAIAQIERGAIASSLVILRRYSDTLSLAYFKMYLDSSLLFMEIKKHDNGTAQPNLSAESLSRFLFPLPPIREQERIVARVEELLGVAGEM